MSNPLIDHLEAMAKEEVEIARAKNHDYAGDADPLANFRLAETLGLCSMEAAIAVRFLDKVARLCRLMNNPAAVTGESLRDTISDGRNYLGILDYALRRRADHV